MKNKINIVLVDDIKFSRKVISYIINKHFDDQVNIIEANNSNDVQSIFSKNIKIHGIISDIMMPNGDGVELINILSSNNYKIPMVIVSSLTTKVIEQTMEQAESGGVNILSAFKKPILAEDIIMSIENFLLQNMIHSRGEHYV
ncbi:two-component system response regulator [Aliivibrio sp. EL58]|uniref:response regulator n=1 Tax=Aliivibrio sp. EL58 TaxID=2107582 RepID=UPI000EFCF730|nr:response regulator [Aliivibrio sp. EL58]